MLSILITRTDASVSKVAYPPDQSLAHFGEDWLQLYSNLPCGQVKLMAIVIGLHDNVRCPTTGNFYE